ncbi:MAG: ATP-binding protein [Bacteroidales bacterium]
MNSFMQLPEDIFKSVPFAICVWKDTDGNPLAFATPSAGELLGLDPEYITSPDFRFTDCIYKPDLKRYELALRFMRTDRRSNYTMPPYQIVTPDGTRKWVEQTIYKRFEDNGQSVFVGYLRDISQHMSSNQCLRKIVMAEDMSGAPVIIGASRDEIERKDQLLQCAAIVGKVLLAEMPLENVINEALTILGETIMRDRIYLFEMHEDSLEGKATCSQRYEWVNKGIIPQIDNPELQNVTMEPEFSRWINLLKQGEAVRGNVDEFPAPEAELLAPQGIISLLVLPVWVEEHCWGFVGIDDCKTRDNWSQGEVAILGSLASSIGMAIIKWRNREELIHAKDRAEESDRLKTAFLQNISHEIRTPMNGILGFIDLLSEEGLSVDMQHEYLKVIKQSSNRLLNTVNDIINFSKIEAGIVVTVEQVVNVNTQLEQLYKFFLPEVEKKGLFLVLGDGVSDRRARIYTDEEKLYAIMTNLIKNAIKYSNTGTIEIGYDVNKDKIVFYVKDQGIGIPKDRQKAIFERFVQADITASRSFEGAGLGLSIVSAYVKMMKGEIFLDSEEGKGSVFYVALPYNVAKEGEPMEALTEAYKATAKVVTVAPVMEVPVVLPPVEIVEEPVSEFVEDSLSQKSLSHGNRILIVEDDETNVFYLKMLLTPFPYELDYAVNGKIAVDKVMNGEYNLILMDVKMPVMDGYEATRQIRTFNTTVPIVAQTAFAMDGDREQLLAIGCNDYISKPCSRSGLLEMVRKYIQ